MIKWLSPSHAVQVPGPGHGAVYSEGALVRFSYLCHKHSWRLVSEVMLDPDKLTITTNLVCRHMSVLPVLGRQRQQDLWGSMARQATLIG